MIGNKKTLDVGSTFFEKEEEKEIYHSEKQKMMCFWVVFVEEEVTKGVSDDLVSTGCSFASEDFKRT
jgi:hypothetical protein